LANDQPLYRELRLYTQKGDALVLYVGLERLTDGQFSVCQAEFLYEDDDLEKRLADIAFNTASMVLGLEEVSDCDFHPSIEDAVAAHDRDFQAVTKEGSNA